MVTSTLCFLELLVIRAYRFSVQSLCSTGGPVVAVHQQYSVARRWLALHACAVFPIFSENCYISFFIINQTQILYAT